MPLILAAPAAAKLVGGALNHLGVHISFGHAVDTEKNIAPTLYTMADNGNLMAFAAVISRHGIHTAGFAELYAPFLGRLQADHPSWYPDALKLEQNPPSGLKQLWAYPQAEVVNVVEANAIHVPGTGTGAVPNVQLGGGGGSGGGGGGVSPVVIVAGLGVVAVVVAMVL